MTEKGKLRKARKEAVAAGHSYNIELNENGHPVMVRERTAKEERKHEDAMERWARRMVDRDWD